LGCVADGNSIVISRGFDGSTRLPSVERLRSCSSYTMMLPSMPSARLGCVADGNSIVIARGFDGSTRLPSVERLRSCSSYTMVLPSMPSARSNFGVCEYGAMIYVVGGYGKGVTSTVLQFDGHTWSEGSQLNIAYTATKVYSLFASILLYLSSSGREAK
uniref:IPT/TIG domain-containing protein n=1 Tax=Toxocara canis TaxID=6265 RepID=A0A183UXJ7_TOXCA